MTTQAKPDPVRQTPPAWLRNLVHCQIRLQRFLSGQPRFDDSLSASDYLRRLQTFWAATAAASSGGLSNEQRLVQLSIAQSRILAQQSDLSTSAREMIQQALGEPATPGAAPPAAHWIGITETTHHQFVPLAGMFVLVKNPDKALSGENDCLVLGELGQLWRCFSSFAELWGYLSQGFAGEEGRIRLLNRLPAQYHADVSSDPLDFVHEHLHLAPEAMPLPPFHAVVRRLLVRQRRDIAWLIETGSDLTALAHDETQLAWSLSELYNAREVIAAHRNPAAYTYGVIARKLARAMPDLHVQGRRFMQAQVKELSGIDVDPDRIWLHYFDSASSSDESFTGWQHGSHPRRSLTLSQLALANFTVDDESSRPGALDQVAGFYTDGTDNPGGYGVHNEIRLLPSALMARNWSLDFYSRFTALSEDFWDKHAQDYRAMLKGLFVATCRNARREGRLLAADYQALMALAGGPGDTTTPVTLELLNSRQGVSGTAVRHFDLYGYASSDILHFSLGSGRQFLYLPEAQQAQLVAFDSTEQLQAWARTQAQDPTRRAALAAHFSLYLRQDGKTWSGVDSALKGLADGSWSPDATVDLEDRPITGDIFDALLNSIRERQCSDTDNLTTSNGELNKALWIADLSAFEQVTLPMVPLGWPIGLASACAGTALLGLGIDQTANADTLTERKQGAWATFHATLDMLFSVGGTAEVEDPFSPPEIEEPLPLAPHAVAASQLRGISADADGIYRLEHNAWYVRCGLQVYRIAIGSARDTVAVIRPEGDSASPLFFLRRSSLSGLWQRIGLKGGEVVVEDPWVRLHVSSGGRSEVFKAVIGGYQKSFCYNLEQNAFQVVSMNPQTRLWQVIDARLYRPQANGMVLVEARLDATNVERMATLKALDMDVDLPMDFPLLPVEETTPVPAQIFNLWIGDQPIKPELIRNLENNAQLARRGARPFALKLYLSSEHPEVFEQNRAALAADAPTVEVIDLERSAFYREFQNTPSFEQYRAAIDGNGGVARNFSSASDVLRYPIMKYHGGLYMDLDDTLTEAWQGADIETSVTGIAVNEPVSNNALGLEVGFNTSCFATQQGNPLLEAISAEMHARYLQNLDIYREPRPIAEGAMDQSFKTYMQRISHICGPGLFNDVIDQHLPHLRRLKMPYRLVSKALLLSPDFRQLLLAVIERGSPLRRLIKIGSEHSWKTTR